MKYNEFFGSKLNSALLLILIILIVIAFRLMFENKEVCLSSLSQNQEQAE